MKPKKCHYKRSVTVTGFNVSREACISTLRLRISFTNFGAVQSPNHLELGLQMCISYTNMYGLCCVKTILWHLPRSWSYTTYTIWGSGFSAQVLPDTKRILEKNINKLLKYFALFFCIIIICTELFLCQRYWIKSSSQWLAGTAGCPPATTSSWWCC